MTHEEALKDLRVQINQIDEELVSLFARRMEAVAAVADVKQRENLALQDRAREAAVIARAQDQVPEGLRGETALFMSALMSLSKVHQRRLLFSGKEFALPKSVPNETAQPVCMYQGVPGAWSEEAAMQYLPKAPKKAAATFEDVFQAVQRGAADYGVVPIENSRTGSIQETYDLLRRYGCFIVGKIAIPIRHCLLAMPGAGLSDIKTVLSHPEGLQQCRGFLKAQGFEQTASRNTAVAAMTVAAQNDPSLGAIASRRAAECHGLTVLVPDIMDAHDNQTTFVAIARQCVYTQADDLTAFTFSTDHRSGALCEALLPFLAAGLNLLRIESRPDLDGNVRFFGEIQGNLLVPAVRGALAEAAAACSYFEILGCYRSIENPKEIPCMSASGRGK